MRDLTYEFDTKNTVLETYEWDNTWIEFANDKFANRILYIGDSISGDTRYYLNELLNDNALVDRFGTSKSLDNPYFFESLKVYTKQLPKIDAILFNNGLHGWHLNDDSEYPAHYEKMLEFLIKEYNVPIYIVLTTFVKDIERNNRVIERNSAVLKIAEKYNLKTIDLYTASKENSFMMFEDGVHFVQEGYKLLAQTIYNGLKENL